MSEPLVQGLLGSIWGDAGPAGQAAPDDGRGQPQGLLGQARAPETHTVSTVLCMAKCQCLQTGSLKPEPPTPHPPAPPAPQIKYHVTLPCDSAM